MLPAVPGSVPASVPVPASAPEAALLPAGVPAPAANSPLPRPPPAPFSHRPRAGVAGMRLLPLGGFCWGAGSGSGAGTGPRARGDHVLIRVTKGYLRLRLPGGEAVLGPGTLRFLPAGTAFSALPQPGAEGQVLLVTRDVARAAQPALPAHPLTLRPSAALDQMLAGDLAALAVGLRHSTPDSGEEATARLGLIARSLRRAVAGEGGDQGAAAALAQPETPPRQTQPEAGTEQAEPRPEAAPAAAAHALIAAFLALAATQPGRGWTIADYADALGVSAAMLDRACLHLRGRRALDLLYELRLHHSLTLLREGRLSLTEIAAQTGYAGPGHLNRAILAATGRGAAGFMDR